MAETATGAGEPPRLRLWRRVRFWLILAVMATLAQGWAHSMRNYCRVALRLGTVELRFSSVSGSIYQSLIVPDTSTSRFFDSKPFATPLNQETLFPPLQLAFRPATLVEPTHFAVVPYWLLLMGAFFAGIVAPGAWRRSVSPPSPGKSIRVANWCAGWTVLAIVLILGGRWWGSRQPRVDETSHFTLTTVPGEAVRGKLCGKATHQDGTPMAGLWLYPANAKPLRTTTDGSFEIPYTRGEAILRVGPDDVRITLHPNKPMFWHIEEKQS